MNPTAEQIEQFLKWLGHPSNELGLEWAYGNESHKDVAAAYAEHLEGEADA